MIEQYICPSCKSDNIQQLSVIYENGLSNISTTSKGTAIGITRGGIGVGVGRSKTKGTSQTVASQKAAPPVKKPFLKPLLIIFGLYVIIQINSTPESIGGIIVWLTATVGWIFYALRYNTKTWPPLKATWDNSYLCNRCNEMFCLSK